VDSSRLLTGSADNSMRLWDIKTGKQLFKWSTLSAVRAVSFRYGDRQALFVTDATMGQVSTVHFVNIENDSSKRNIKLIFRI
jgi:translation initiation factor 3 subunit I